MTTEHPETACVGTTCGPQTAPTRPVPVGFIRFHGLTLLTVSHNGHDHVPVRPICDLIGVDWQGQKRTLKDAYKVQLYGTCWLFPPEIAGFPELKFASACYIRVNRMEAFLLNISLKRVKANGNVDAANWLMALQHEWADALHAYETHGIAVKAGRTTVLDELLKMTRLRNQLSDPQKRREVDQLIHERLQALGSVPDTPDDDQLPLPLPQGA